MNIRQHALTVPLALLCGICMAGRAARGQTTAHVDQPMSSATFVNLYWDSTWDADNPGMKTEAVDAVTRAVVNSTYFSGLAEYGVASVSFGGSFLPDSSCPLKAPNSVGFYDPFKTSIAGFVQCEHDHGPAVLRQANMVYNVILPASSMESDFFSQNFCTGAGSPAAWHYHGLEDSFPAFNGPPIYTIVLTNPRCGSNALFASLFHEMAESLTDPFPIDISIIPPHINLSTENEVADICENAPPVPIFTDSTGKTPLSTPISIPTYWSNRNQSCTSFTDATVPAISNVSDNVSYGLGGKIVKDDLSLSGTGFGSMPSQISLPDAALPYLTAQSGGNWEAGNTINLDSMSITTDAWSGNSASAAIGAPQANGQYGLPPGAVPAGSVTAWLCNPDSLRCASQSEAVPQSPANNPSSGPNNPSHGTGSASNGCGAWCNFHRKLYQVWKRF